MPKVIPLATLLSMTPEDVINHKDKYLLDFCLRHVKADRKEDQEKLIDLRSILYRNPL